MHACMHAKRETSKYTLYAPPPAICNNALFYVYTTKINQVVAAGTVGGLMRVLFCAKEATSNGTGAWFLAELLQDESALTLEATFKSKSAAAVPGFVQAFMLHHIFTMANA